MPSQNTVKRECGPCTACCTTHLVRELKKPAQTLCKHVDERGFSCSIYEQRPQSCRDYSCWWLAEARPDINRNTRYRVLLPSDRPDLSGIVVDIGKMNGVGDLPQDVFVIREFRPGALNTLAGCALVERLGRYLPVVGLGSGN